MVTLFRLLFGLARIPVRLFSDWFMLNPRDEVMRCRYERIQLRAALAAEEEAAQEVDLPGQLEQQEIAPPPFPGQRTDLEHRVPPRSAGSA